MKNMKLKSRRVRPNKIVFKTGWIKRSGEIIVCAE